MREALAFLTIIGRGEPLSTRALRWFPVVGALLGLAVGGSWWVLTHAFPPPLAAVLVVTIDLALTGMLHVDGLADAADGLLPHGRREWRLAVMRSPEVGAFGITAVATVLIARTVAMDSRVVSIAAVTALWCTSRALAALVPSCMTAARPDGLGATLRTGRRPVGAVIGVLVAIAGATMGCGGPGAAAVAAGTMAFVAVLLCARRRLGGYTGDVLGAAIVLCETSGLVVMRARW